MFSMLSNVLEQKALREVYTVSPEELVSNAVYRMNEHKIGALLVLEQDRLIGIVTERDVIAKVVGGDRDAKTTLVSEIMTVDPVTAEPSWTVEHAMRVVTDKRVRHLPVVKDGTVVGLISIGDLTKSIIDEQVIQVDAAIRATKAGKRVI